MTCTVITAHNPFDRNSWLRQENVPDLAEFILQEFAPFYGPVWPKSARIYLESIDQEHDITPVTAAMAEALHRVSGTAYIVVWPADPVVAPLFINLGIVLGVQLIRGATGDDRLRAGGPRKGTNRVIPKGSPNNIPGQRQNTARVEERIPDIFGRVRSTPDLIQVPYITYVNNLQHEISYMCIGRGDYDIQSHHVREGDTRVDQLVDTSIEIYPSGQIPGGGTPQLTIGPAINEPVFTVVPIDSVKGDVLLPPNAQALYGDDLMSWFTRNNPSGGQLAAQPVDNPFVRAVKFFYPSTGVGRVTFPLTGTGGNPLELGGLSIQDRFPVGTKFGLEWTTQCVSVHPRDVTHGSGGAINAPNIRLMPDTADDDHYEVLAVDTTTSAVDVIIDFSVPASIQSEWDKLLLYNPAGTAGTLYEITAPGEVYNIGCIFYPLNYRQGPYFVDDPDMEFIKLNFVAERGLYTDDGKTQFAQFRDIVVEITPADETGIATGPKEVFAYPTNGLRMSGSPVSRDFIGISVNYFPSFGGRFLISVYNTTNTLNRHASWSWEQYNRTVGPLQPWDGVTDAKQFKGDVQDEIRWMHGYSMSTPPNVSFGGVTTVQAKVVQRKNQKPQDAERRLNMLVTRKLAAWDGSALTGFAANFSGRDALFALLKDPDIGNVPDEHIDFAQISDAFESVNDAFGDVRAVQFSHTFDSDNASLEDLLAAVGDACFCQIYREGDVIKASPDVSTNASTILFNHRNKIPGSEVRSTSWGTEEDYDGIKVEYADDTDDRIKNFVIPTEGATKKPKRLAPAGIRTRAKAAMHAWRSYNELLYKNTYVQFEACEEATLSLVNDRIVVANNIRNDTVDGDILAVDGLLLTLSQQFLLSGSAFIFVQHIDGTTESIEIALQDTPNTIYLANAPAIPLFVDTDNGIFPRFTIVQTTTADHKHFRILEKSYKAPGIFNVTAYNYSEGYYLGDGLHIYLAFKTITGNPSVGAFTDRGPYAMVITPTGASTITDPVRGQVYRGDAVADHIDVSADSRTLQNPTSFTSYTIACWIWKDTNVVVGNILTSADSDALKFTLTGGTNFVQCIHNNVMYLQAAILLNTWTHLAVTFDAATNEMALYKDGEQVNTASLVPAFGAMSALKIFGNNGFADGLVGMADDFRMYRVAKSPEFIRDLYQKTRIV